MNIVTNSISNTWQATPSFQRVEPAQAPAQAALQSSAPSPADSGAPRSEDQSASKATGNSAPEIQAYLMRVQELGPSADARANNDEAVLNTSTSFDGGDAATAIEDDMQTLLDGQSVNAMNVMVSGTTAIVSFSDGSHPLTLNLAQGSVTLSFADGTTAQIMAQTPSRSLAAAYEAEEEASRGFKKVA